MIATCFIATNDNEEDRTGHPGGRDHGHDAVAGDALEKQAPGQVTALPELAAGRSAGRGPGAAPPSSAGRSPPAGGGAEM